MERVRGGLCSTVGQTVGQFLDPTQLSLCKDLARGRHLGSTVQQKGPQNDLVWHDGLVVVDVAAAAGAEVAIYGFTCSRKEENVSHVYRWE